MKFTLEIELGNAGMQTGMDIAEALQQVAERMTLQGISFPEEMDAFDRKGGIRDVNGNVVGKFEIAVPSPAQRPHAYAPNDLGTDGCSVCGKSVHYKIHKGEK